MVNKIWICLAIFFALPFVAGAHFIVGIVNNASDGELANGKTVVLWNPANGLVDNLTDVVGPSGNSGADNIYFIDCELLQTPCEVGNTIKAKVLDSGDSYLSGEVSLTVSGAGFDIMQNITLNSPPRVFNLTIDDNQGVPFGEIDLLPLDKQTVFCSGIVYESAGEAALANLTAEFFDNSVSHFRDNDDKNFHYANNSCYLDSSYGDSNQVLFNCTFQVEYYANPKTWNCTVFAQDNLSAWKVYSNLTFVNYLLALSIDSPLDFGALSTAQVSSERMLNVTNAGNAVINLSLSGYGAVEGDGFAYNCSVGQNISIGYMKYNLTASNPGALTLTQFQQLYRNLTSNVVIRKFNLPYRTDDSQPGTGEVNSTYWRVYVPPTVSGSCSGNIIFGAVQAAGS